MANVKKPTKREMYELIKSKNAEDTLIVEFCDKQIELLARKNSTADAKKNEEHEALMGIIKTVLYNSEKPMTCSEIMKAVNKAENTEHSSSKISSMLGKLGEKGTNEVVRFVEKKVAYFRLAD
jgi:hypothetical protein